MLLKPNNSCSINLWKSILSFGFFTFLEFNIHNLFWVRWETTTLMATTAKFRIRVPKNFRKCLLRPKTLGAQEVKTILPSSCYLETYPKHQTHQTLMNVQLIEIWIYGLAIQKSAKPWIVTAQEAQELKKKEKVIINHILTLTIVREHWKAFKCRKMT